jgi:hypothetical protein
MGNLNNPVWPAMQGAGVSANAPNYIAVTADMTSATWNAVATQETLAVTGLCRIRTWVNCTGTLTDAADLATIQYGYAGTTNAFIAATGAAGNGGNTISDGEIWIDATPADTIDTYANMVFDYVSDGIDIGYEIAGEALTGGSLVFHYVWEPMEAGASCVAGAGGAL